MCILYHEERPLPAVQNNELKRERDVRVCDQQQLDSVLFVTWLIINNDLQKSHKKHCNKLSNPKEQPAKMHAIWFFTCKT